MHLVRFYFSVLLMFISNRDRLSRCVRHHRSTQPPCQRINDKDGARDASASRASLHFFFFLFSFPYCTNAYQQMNRLWVRPPSVLYTRNACTTVLNSFFLKYRFISFEKQGRRCVRVMTAPYSEYFLFIYFLSSTSLPDEDSYFFLSFFTFYC